MKRHVKTICRVFYLSEETKTSEGKVIFSFGIWLRHMKTKNKLDLVPNRIVAGLVGVFENGGGLGTGE